MGSTLKSTGSHMEMEDETYRNPCETVAWMRSETPDAHWIISFCVFLSWVFISVILTWSFTHGICRTSSAKIRHDLCLVCDHLEEEYRESGNHPMKTSYEKEGLKHKLRLFYLLFTALETHYLLITLLCLFTPRWCLIIIFRDLGFISLC